MKKPSGYDLNLASKKLSISNNGTNWHYESLDMGKGEVLSTTTYVELLPKIFNLSLMIRKQSDMSRFGNNCLPSTRISML